MGRAVRKMYKSREVLPNVWCISSTAVMCWLVIGKTGAMLVDTAYGYEDLSQAVREITKLPLTVVNTHTHIDHSGGNFFFDSPVYISEADRALYDIHSKAQAHREMEKTLKIFKYIVFWRNVLPRDPERNDSRRENFNNFKYVKDGDSFDLGGMTAIIVEIPGHTQGSIAVYLPEKMRLSPLTVRTPLHGSSCPSRRTCQSTAIA